MTSSRPRIIVALSGGVDSAVAALRLLQEGYSVAGLHMTNWEDGGEYCSAGRDLEDARRVAADLGITLHHVNFAREYRERVFADFLAEYRAGRTPNPDVACNRHIKFGEFLKHASRLGGELIATGHYASIRRDALPHDAIAHDVLPHDDAVARLYAARDDDKDQTYFLHAVEGQALRRVLFPLGDLTKSEVRRLARDAGLANHARRDSTGICFIGERPFRDFLAQFIETNPGDIVTPDGTVVGRHDGLPYYTLGQRQGLKVGGMVGGAGEPWYVADKDPERNALVVVQGHDHPLLFSDGLGATDPHWINGEPDVLRNRGVMKSVVRIRHRHSPVPCEVARKADGSLDVRFQTPQRAVTPGQYAVFYADRECLGGAVIHSRKAGWQSDRSTLRTTA